MSAILGISASLKQYLDENDAHYELVPHRRDYSAQAAAADTHTPGKAFAKCVLIWADNYYALVVLPADHRLDFALLRDSIGATDAGLVREEEMLRLFPDCELGAEPPFGNLYDLPVYVASQLAADDTITFNGGTHEEAVRMPYREFERLVEPTVIDCATKA